MEILSLRVHVLSRSTYLFYKIWNCVCHQVFQLQQEKKKLQEDFSSLLQDRETLERRCATIQREQTQLGPRLEETKWEVSQTLGVCCTLLPTILAVVDSLIKA